MNDLNQPHQEATHDGDIKPHTLHEEHHPAQPSSSKWKLSQTGDGDTAMALFERPDELEDPMDPMEEKKLIRKIDFMILPYLAVCYAFFYIGW